MAVPFPPLSQTCGAIKGQGAAGIAGLMYVACGVFKDDVRQHRRIHRFRQVRAEADADVERPVEMEFDWRAKLMHGLAVEADEERKLVTVFFNTDALGDDGDEAVRRLAAWTAAATEAELHVCDAHIAVGTPGE